MWCLYYLSFTPDILPGTYKFRILCKAKGMEGVVKAEKVCICCSLFLYQYGQNVIFISIWTKCYIHALFFHKIFVFLNMTASSWLTSIYGCQYSVTILMLAPSQALVDIIHVQMYVNSVISHIFRFCFVFFYNIEDGHLRELLFNTRFYGGIHTSI